MEEKERLVESSIFIMLKESEHFESSKEKQSELEKSERVMENECFIEKQESEKEEQREKEIVVLEKSEDGMLAYEPIKTINFFSSNSYLSFQICFKEIKLFSLVFMENEYQFYFLNSRGTLLEKKQFIRVEDQGRSMEEDLGTILEDLSISLSLNPSFSFHEASSMHSSAKFDPSCYGFGMLDDTSFVDPNIVGLEISDALFDILHDEYLGKFIEEVDYAFPFLGAFMKNLDRIKLESFEEQGKVSKLFSICSISKDQSREQIVVFNQGLNGYFKSLSYRLSREEYRSNQYARSLPSLQLCCCGLVTTAGLGN
ncbi:hypothetical protein M9H77_03973 [Catharanthus roseus]|uniref:Uncharacterized protein n=1 Tax=Catharanthus roseus TaxID=4058 RepID=A0ACC0CCT4_CATRO|nr:hypothetical protein M9H77_03973 [Catharanthus roseus]